MTDTDKVAKTIKDVDVAAQSDKLMKARCRLLTRNPVYGTFAMNMKWIPHEMSHIKDERSKTLGVCIMGNGEVECIYYPPFIDKLSVEECYAAVQHEIEHIVRLHPLRCGDRDHRAFNIACDMTVNGTRNSPRIGYSDNNKMILPLPADNMVWIPKEWPENGTAEEYYHLMPKQGGKCPKCGKDKNGGGKGKKDQQQNGGGGKGDKGKDKQDGKGNGGKGDKQEQGDGGGCGDGKCPHCGHDGDGDYDGFGQTMDNHDIWKRSDVSEDEARQVVKDMLEQAISRNPGSAPGHFLEILKDLSKPVIRWREVLKQFIGRHCGNRRLTYARRSRRKDDFGTPGFSHHAAATISVIVDTSGSVSTKLLEQFFAEIDAISHKTKVFVLQWDHAYQGYGKYRRGDWKNYKINGRGGTDMSAPFTHLEEKGQQNDCVILLTDGEVGAWPAKKNYPCIVCIGNDRELKGPDWCQTCYIKI